jgi:MFS family permease
MRLTALTQSIGGVALLIVFLDVPLAVRIVMSFIGTAFVVAGFPALNALTAGLVPAPLRGMAFSVTGFFTALAGAASPLLIGFLADRFDYTVDGEVKGDLARAFLLVTPLLFVGAAVLWRGRDLTEEPSAAA